MSEQLDFKQQQEAKYITMTQTPIPSLVSRLAVPTVLSMLISSIYNMADTYFVSQISTSASAAVGIIFSIMAVIQAVGFTFGTGASSLISRLLGEKEREGACRCLSTAIFCTFGVGMLLMAGGLWHLEELVRLLGATESIAPYARDYARIILIGAPYMATNFALNNVLRGQGNAFFAMIGIMSGGVLNIVLDPIFIFTLDMGISGAALATILSQFISFLILLYFNLGRNGTLPIKFKYFTFSPKLIGEIIRIGLPSLCRQGLMSLSMVFMMRCCTPFGDAAMAAISIVLRIMMFLGSAMLGFGQGFQPVCGFNFGAKRFDRVWEAFWFCVKISFIILSVLGAAMFLVAPQVIAAFRKDDLEVIAIGTAALRMQCVILPLQSFFVTSNMYLQVTGQSMRATILSSCRQGIYYIPATLVLPIFFGVWGAAMVQPFADVLSFATAAVFSLRFLGDLKRLKDNGACEEGGLDG